MVLSQITNDSGLLAAAEKMLDHSGGLETSLLNNLVVENGRQVSIKVDYARMTRIVRKIACGIFAFRYRRVVPLNSIGPVEFSPHQPSTAWAVMTHTERFQPKRWTRVGWGAFAYLIAKDGMSAKRLCCLMDFYGTLFAAAYIPHVRGTRLTRRRSVGEGHPELPLSSRK